MTLCEICMKPLGPGDALLHAACDAELDRRLAAGRCTRCGEGDAEAGSCCAQCASSGGAMYRGYPGGP